MSEVQATLLNLHLAWRRVKNDMQKRVFVRHPYELAIIEQDLDVWLMTLQHSIREDLYNPESAVVCEVPKGKGAVRPGAHLSLADRVVYAACIGACFNEIYNHLRWTQGTVDYSYRLNDNQDNPEWFRNQFQGWQDFRNQSLRKINEGATHVVIVDITAYYENIDLVLLASDLRQIGMSTDVLNLLSAGLNRWAQVNGRGIPQGHSPSDILGKIYLNNIDQNIRAMGYTHLRYVDDIRLFCRNLVEAKKALIDLSRLLRKRGLNLQSAKSEIHHAADARNIIEGVLPVLRTVRRNFIEQVITLFGSDNPYISLIEAEEILLQSPEQAPIELIREAYQTYFIDSPDSQFNKTLFHFLLNRLGAQKDNFAVAHCVTLLEKHPEETNTMLDYFKAVNATNNVEPAIVNFLNAPDAVYTYQNYQMIEWFNSLQRQPSNEIISIARRFAFDSAQPSYLRSACRQLIGEHGTPADLERLEADYAEARSPLEQSEIICSLKRMERGRRNSFLRRVEGDSFLNRNAVRIVRNTSF